MYTTDRITLQNKEMDRYTSKQATWKTFGHGHSHSQRHIQTHTQPHSHGHLHIQLSHVRKPTGSGVEWAECSLMMGRAVEFKFLAWSSITRFVSGHSVCWWFGVWDPGLKSCIQQWKTTCLHSIWISLACVRASKLSTTQTHKQTHSQRHLHIQLHATILNTTFTQIFIAHKSTYFIAIYTRFNNAKNNFYSSSFKAVLRRHCDATPQRLIRCYNTDVLPSATYVYST